MPIEARDWSNPFSWLEKTLFKCQEAEKSGLTAAYSRFNAKLHHLGLIWKRLEYDTASYEKLMGLMVKSIKEGTSVDEISTQLFLNHGYLILDLEDFVIHSRILMDRTGILVAHLIKGSARALRHASFKGHRRFFLDPKNVPYNPDEEYARYVREQTGWFEILRDARDILLVHDSSLRGAGVLLGPQTAPRRMQSQLLAWGSQQQKAYEHLLQLRDKYSKTIGEPLSKESNIWELLDLFDKHANALTSDDLKFLTEIKRETGGKLPDVNMLSTHILDFVKYISDHLRKQYNTKA